MAVETGGLAWHYSDTKITNGDWSIAQHNLPICVEGPSCHICSIEEPVFYVHQDCWMAARRRRPGLGIPKTLELACATQPIIDWRFLQKDSDTAKHILVVSWDNVQTLMQDTDLSRLLRRVAQKLPAVLQDAIVDELRGTLVFSLLATLGTVCLLDLVAPRGPPRVPEPVFVATNHDFVASIKMEPIDLYGKMYIRRLEFSPRHDPGSRSIPVKDKDIQGLTYSLGDFGLQAVRVDYADGTRSPWLGVESPGWYGTLEGKDLLQLRVVRDVGTGGHSTKYNTLTMGRT